MNDTIVEVTTLKEVAAACGLAPITVSRILNGQRKENRPSMIERAEQVRRVAEELGYRPNRSARRMREGRTGTVALVQSDRPGSTHLPWMMRHHLLQALSQRGTLLGLVQLPEERLTDPDYVPGILSELVADGLLMDYIAAVPQRIRDLIGHYRVPVVWLNNDLATDAVRPDDHACGRQAAVHLLERGHRRIAWLDGTGSHFSRGHRTAGVVAACSEAGVEPVLVPQAVATDPHALGPYLRRSGCTAVVAYSDHEATVAGYALARVGLAIPEDCSLIAIHSHQVAPFGLPLTTSRVPLGQVAVAAVDLLDRRMADPDQARPSVVVDSPGIDAGATVAAPA